MAQPPHIPQQNKKDSEPISLRYEKSKSSYSSPAYVPQAWRSNRPGDISDLGNPQISGFGNQGPDQGYLLKLAEAFENQLHLFEGEHKKDAMEGCGWLALRRASLSGRAPMAEDLEVAFRLFGYLYENPPMELVDFRRDLLQGVAHEPTEFRTQITELVTESTLSSTPEDIAEFQRSDWKLAFNLK